MPFLTSSSDLWSPATQMNMPSLTSGGEYSSFSPSASMGTLHVAAITTTIHQITKMIIHYELQKKIYYVKFGAEIWYRILYKNTIYTYSDSHLVLYPICHLHYMSGITQINVPTCLSGLWSFDISVCNLLICQLHFLTVSCCSDVFLILLVTLLKCICRIILRIHCYIDG